MLGVSWECIRDPSQGLGFNHQVHFNPERAPWHGFAYWSFLILLDEQRLQKQ